MKYVKLTDSPQKVRIAAMGGGTCPRFPGTGIVLGGYEVNAVIDASMVELLGAGTHRRTDVEAALAN
jgi:hypothetical protein